MKVSRLVALLSHLMQLKGQQLILRLHVTLHTPALFLRLALHMTFRSGLRAEGTAGPLVRCVSGGTTEVKHLSLQMRCGYIFKG